MKLILCDGVTVTSNLGITVDGPGSSLTVYAQEAGTGTVAGTASGGCDIIFGDGSLTVCGGTYKWLGASGYGYVEMSFDDITVNGGSFTNCTLSAENSVTVNGGTIDDDENTFINCPDGAVTINGGDITLSTYETAVDCDSFVFTGGQLKDARRPLLHDPGRRRSRRFYGHGKRRDDRARHADADRRRL